MGASGDPDAAMPWLARAERWKGPLEDIPVEPACVTLGAKASKALIAVVTG